MFQYILFDLDGTLTDPKIGITTCVQYALKSFGIDEPDPDKLEPFIGPPLLESFQQFYGMSKEQSVKAVEKYRERFSTIGLYENEIYPGIAGMLKVLSEKGAKLAVASSKPEHFVEQILDYFHIREYFTAVVGSNLDGSRVAKPEVVEEALRRLGILTEITQNATESNGKAAETAKKIAATTKSKELSCAMVGDRKFDVEGAKAMNVTSVAVAYGYAQGDELVLAEPDYIAETVEELQNILLQ